MHKLLAIIIIALFTRCSFTGGMLPHNSETTIVLKENNYRVIGNVTGKATASYFLMIPVEGKRALFASALYNLRSSIKGHQGKATALIDYSTDVDVTHFLYPLIYSKTLTIQATLIEFIDNETFTQPNPTFKQKAQENKEESKTTIPATATQTMPIVKDTTTKAIPQLTTTTVLNKSSNQQPLSITESKPIAKTRMEFDGLKEINIKNIEIGLAVVIDSYDGNIYKGKIIHKDGIKIILDNDSARLLIPNHSIRKVFEP